MKDKKVEIKCFLFVGMAILAASNGLIASRQEGKSFIAVFIISLLLFCTAPIAEYLGRLLTHRSGSPVVGEISMMLSLLYYLVIALIAVGLSSGKSFAALLQELQGSLCIVLAGVAVLSTITYFYYKKLLLVNNI